MLRALRSRSKSSAPRPDTLTLSSSRPHSRSSSKDRPHSSLSSYDDDKDKDDEHYRGRTSYVKTPSDGVPIVKEHHRTRRVSSYHPSQHHQQHSSRSSSSKYLVPVASNSKGVYFVDPRYPSSMSAVIPPQAYPSASYNVPTTAPYFGSHGQVVYPNGASPQSLHLDSSGAHRGRSRHTSTARDKILVSAGAGGPVAVVPVAVPLPLGPPSSHDSHSSGRGSSGGIFGSWVQSIRSRSRSKSRDRDALYAASSSSSSDHHPHPHPQPQHRSAVPSSRHHHYDPVQDELARRMEKDLRLQDLDDPYRPVRRERSRSFDSTNHEQQRRARERAERRNADLDPEVVLNTKYNAQNLKYHSPTDNQHHISSRPHPPTRHMSSGYATDVQPVMLRRNSTQTTVPGLHHHHSSSSSSRHATSSRSDMPLKGWFNRRGDQFIDKNTVICQPMDRQFSSRFKGYPEVGQGYGDSNGNIIDVQGRLIKRIG